MDTSKLRRSLKIAFATLLGFTPGTALGSPFELEGAAGWSGPPGIVLAASTERTQGSASLLVGARGYTLISSTPVDWQVPTTAANVTFDLLLPFEQPNPYWLGSVLISHICAPAFRSVREHPHETPSMVVKID